MTLTWELAATMAAGCLALGVWLGTLWESWSWERRYKPRGSGRVWQHCALCGRDSKRRPWERCECGEGVESLKREKI